MGLNPVADVLKRADKVLKNAEVALTTVDTTLGTVGGTLSTVETTLSDVDVKLHAASLCAPCRERLRRARIDTGVVDALLSVVRELGAGTPAGVQ